MQAPLPPEGRDPIATLKAVLADIVAFLGARAQHAGRAACWASDGLTPLGEQLLTAATTAIAPRAWCAPSPRGGHGPGDRYLGRLRARRAHRRPTHGTPP